ncbi:MAG: hypothetical protein JWN03_8848 [Nocardia sp.]|uniref:hypothetical protein n=1 Tax=Nocardia sp. TaxID=1821 RepID=UPI0026318E5F|nr:hypothetical protein [Nocardia sp.]MCU1648573.1 hypothetical protein [Nocardia sp.]
MLERQPAHTPVDFDLPGRAELPGRNAVPPCGLDLPPVERMPPPSIAVHRSPPPTPEPLVEPRQAPKLPEVAEAVVMRWNPHGLALLLAVQSDTLAPPAASVALIGGDETNSVLLRAELARFVPRIELLATGERPVPVACVLLEAGAPIGREGLGAVQRLRADGTRIVFALDGFHAHCEWREVLERDALLLSAGDPVEIVPVSARMESAARVSGDAALADRSGVGLLHARLVASAGAGPSADQAAIVREKVLAETRRRIGVELQKLRSGGDVAVLRAERATLLAVNDGGRGAVTGMLRNRLHLARVDLLHEVGVRIRALNAVARADIERLPRSGQRGFPQGLQNSVEKITREIDRAIYQRLAELDELVEKAVRASELTAAAGNSGSAPGAGVSAQVGASCSWADRRPRVGPEPEPRCGGVEDHLMIALGASAGFGLGRLVVLPLALWEAVDYALAPVSLLLGAAAAGWVVRARRQLADRAHLRQWVADALVNVKAQLEQRVATALVEAEERLTDHVVRIATAHLVETDRRVGELEAQLRQAAQRRPALLTACERDLGALEFA